MSPEHGQPAGRGTEGQRIRLWDLAKIRPTVISFLPAFHRPGAPQCSPWLLRSCSCVLAPPSPNHVRERHPGTEETGPPGQ